MSFLPCRHKVEESIFFLLMPCIEFKKNTFFLWKSKVNLTWDYKRPCGKIRINAICQNRYLYRGILSAEFPDPIVFSNVQGWIEVSRDQNEYSSFLVRIQQGSGKTLVNTDGQWSVSTITSWWASNSNQTAVNNFL